jgi:hypothetical protein
MGKSDAVFQKKFLRDHSEGYLPYTKCSVDDITGEDFKFLWGLGQPLVLTGCLGRFQMPWTPDYLIHNYGNENCLLVDCNTDEMITSTVGKFFDEFLSMEPTSSLKLKVLLPLKSVDDRTGHQPMISRKYFLNYSQILKMRYLSQRSLDEKVSWILLHGSLRIL